MKKHLAIFTKDAIDRIFAGLKTIETRFSQKRIPPFGVIKIGDLVYIKPPGAEIVGQFLVKKVISFEGLDSAGWQLIKSNYGIQIAATEKYFEGKIQAKYGTIIFIDAVEKFITPPIKISKKDQRGWVVLV